MRMGYYYRFNSSDFSHLHDDDSGNKKLANLKLLEAVNNGDKRLARRLVRFAGADPECELRAEPDDECAACEGCDCVSPLYVAVYNIDHDMVDFLLDEMDVCADICYDDVSPLSALLSFEQTKEVGAMVRKLIDNGALNSVDSAIAAFVEAVFSDIWESAGAYVVPCPLHRSRAVLDGCTPEIRATLTRGELKERTRYRDEPHYESESDNVLTTLAENMLDRKLNKVACYLADVVDLCVSYGLDIGCCDGIVDAVCKTVSRNPTNVEFLVDSMDYRDMLVWTLHHLLEVGARPAPVDDRGFSPTVRWMSESIRGGAMHQNCADFLRLFLPWAYSFGVDAELKTERIGGALSLDVEAVKKEWKLSKEETRGIIRRCVEIIREARSTAAERVRSGCRPERPVRKRPADPYDGKPAQRRLALLQRRIKRAEEVLIDCEEGLEMCWDENDIRDAATDLEYLGSLLPEYEALAAAEMAAADSEPPPNDGLPPI